MILLQTSVETVKGVAKIAETITVPGILGVIILFLGIALTFAIRVILKDKNSMIKNAEKYNERLEAIGNRFMEQTNKLIVFIELQKQRGNNHGN